mgnify:CR=1 FL=1
MLFFPFQGVVDAHSVLDVPLVIEAQCLEEQDVMAHISVFGSPDPPMVIYTYVLFTPV